MNIDHIADQIAKAVTAYAPQAWETAKAVERVNALDWLLTDIGWALIGVLVLLAGFRVRQYGRKLANENGDLYSFFGAVTVALGFVAGVVPAANLLTSPWLYVGLFNPGLALAHDALTKVLH